MTLKVHIQCQVLIKQSLKNSYIQSTYTHKCSMLRYVKEISYLNGRSIMNDISYENISITAYEPQVPRIDNEWEYCSSNYGEVFLKQYNNSSANQTIKRHVQK